MIISPLIVYFFEETIKEFARNVDIVDEYLDMYRSDRQTDKEESSNRTALVLHT